MKPEIRVLAGPAGRQRYMVEDSGVFAASLPPRARSMRQPVVCLVRALYGHPRAGSDWEARLRSQLLKAGWQPIANQTGVWLSPDTACIMAAYIDDVFWGEPKQAAEHMRGLMGLVNMGRVQNVDRFLGTSYHVNFASHQTVTVTVAQPAYAAMLLQRFFFHTPFCDNPRGPSATRAPAARRSRTQTLRQAGGKRR